MASPWDTRFPAIPRGHGGGRAASYWLSNRKQECKCRLKGSHKAVWRRSRGSDRFDAPVCKRVDTAKRQPGRPGRKRCCRQPHSLRLKLSELQTTRSCLSLTTLMSEKCSSDVPRNALLAVLVVEFQRTANDGACPLKAATVGRDPTTL